MGRDLVTTAERLAKLERRVKALEKLVAELDRRTSGLIQYGAPVRLEP